ncbi:MAG TPA: DUF721 domain-containing protein [Planctomycetes bacterium]|nr:DUF721 domain-containing protein [Planctomycetota bacterium]
MAEHRKRSPHDADSIGDILDSWLAKVERETMGPTQRVAAAWQGVIRENERFKKTRVAAFRSGVAVIEVASPPLCAELAQFQRTRLLERLKEFMEGDPVVRDLRFRLGAF